MAAPDRVVRDRRARDRCLPDTAAPDRSGERTKPLVVVVGGMNLDIQAISRGKFLRGDSNPGSVSMLPGGVGRNIAENCARLGLEVELITALGDDHAADALRGSCSELGIGLSGSLAFDSTPSPHYICILGQDGSLEGAVAAMDALERLLPECLESSIELLDSAAAIVVDTNIPSDSIGWLATRYGRRGSPNAASGAGQGCGAGQNGGAVRECGAIREGGRSGGADPTREWRHPLLFLDPVSCAKAVRAEPYIGAFDCAKPNRSEAGVLAARVARFDLRAEEPELDILARILHGRGLGELFISLGGSGFFYSDGHLRGRALAPRSGFPPLLSVSGAGDAACAALVWASLAGFDLPGKAALALSAAALCASSSRTVHPDLTADALCHLSKGVIHESVS